MGDKVEREWRRLRSRIRRRGVPDTTAYVCDLIKNGDYPLYYVFRFGNYMLDRNYLTALGKVLKATRSLKKTHPLIDKLYSSWLWSSGKRRAALAFTAKRAAFWSHSVLYNQLAAMLVVNGQKERAQKVFQIANRFADREIAESKEKGKKSNGHQHPRSQFQ